MKFFAPLFIMLFTLPTFAKQAWLKSAEGYNINIYYDTKYENRNSNKPLEYWNFTNIRVDVQGSLRPSDEMQVILVNKLHRKGYCGSEDYYFQEVYRKTMEPSRVGIFQGEMTRNVEVRSLKDGKFMFAQSLVIEAGTRAYCYSIDVQGQELAVVINGHWLVDPVSGSNNFKLNLR